MAKIWTGKKKSLIRFQVILFIDNNGVTIGFNHESVQILSLITFFVFRLMI